MYLTFSVIHSDGVVHDIELDAMKKIHEHEGIPFDMSNSFQQDVTDLSPNELFKKAMDALKTCTLEEQLKVLAWTYSIIEVDDAVDVKEARFLLYAMNSTDLQLEEIINESRSLPKL
jgi:uncharacterized tellurite resistance protein B-like protein